MTGKKTLKIGDPKENLYHQDHSTVKCSYTT